MVGGSGYFGECDTLILPGDKVAGAGDLNIRFVAAAFHMVGLVDFKQLRMQRSTVELKDKFGNVRSR